MLIVLSANADTCWLTAASANAYKQFGLRRQSGRT